MIRRIAVIGAGVGGAYAALLLARSGFDVDLFESRPDRDKPCGGGVTARTFDLIPELDELSVAPLPVETLRIVTASGRESRTGLSPPLKIFRRKDLDGDLRRLAVEAGANLHVRRVRHIERKGGSWRIEGEFEADFLVGAAGASCPVRRLLRGPQKPTQVALTTGYFVPGQFEPVADVRFFRDVAGYLWWFPRPSGASLGLVWSPGAMRPEQARERIRLYAAEVFPNVNLEKCIPFSAPCPCLSANSLFSPVFQDDGVALVGDSAGLCDAVTSEGIRHALYSAGLLAEALAAGEPGRYYPALAKTILPELQSSAKLKGLFYRNWFLSLIFGLASRSARAREAIASSAFGGRTLHKTLRDAVGGWPTIIRQALLGGEGGPGR